MVVVISPSTAKSRRRDLYAESAVLLSENPHQFAAFFDELCRELKPVGLLEEDQVATIAQLLWRKHRRQIFRSAEQALADFRRKDELEAKALIFARYLEEEEEDKLSPGETRAEGIEESAKENRVSASSGETRSQGVEQSAEEEEKLSAYLAEVEKEMSEKRAEEKEQAALRDVTPERYIEHLEMIERLERIPVDFTHSLHA
jgi:hypothetical protein